MSEPHDFHEFDAECGYEVRQTTPAGEADRFEVRDRSGRVVVLDDEEFKQLRADGPNPRGL